MERLSNKKVVELESLVKPYGYINVEAYQVFDCLNNPTVIVKAMHNGIQVTIGQRETLAKSINEALTYCAEMYVELS
jgi:hypothetical protein